MAITAERRTELLAQISDNDDAITALNAAILAGSVEVERFTLDTGEARQTSQFRDVNDLIKARRALQSENRNLKQELNGTGLMNMNLRRKRGRYYV